MKIRTQLAVAFLLLAVVPLTGIVVYSYFSSLRAVRRATEEQARTMTQEMGGRMASIKQELGRGVARLGEVPVQDLLTAARSSREGQANPMVDRMVMGFGEAAPYLRALEFIPMPPSQLEARQEPAPPTPPDVPQPPAAPSREARPWSLTGGRVVIDVPHILRQARREVEASPEKNEVGLLAIDTALGALAGEEPQPPSGRTESRSGAPPEAPPGPVMAIAQEIRKQIHQEMAAEAADRRKAAAEIKAPESERREAAKQRAKAERLMLGRDFEVPVREGGRVVGKVKAQVSGDALLRRLLARTRIREGEIPFAVDAEGQLHTVNKEDRRKIEGLHTAFAAQIRAGSGPWAFGDWAVATSKDPDSGLVFGIARPVPLQDVRRTAARNFGYGVGMIGLALLGILPLSTRMTRNLKLVTEGADRIATGDLDARVPVRSRNEFGKLALAFNHMASDLKEHQERLLEEERLRKEREIEQALLQTEYDRKSRELEEARRFQLSLLPKTLPQHPAFQIAVSMRTATEVGGDYYDFHLSDDGALTTAVGDATGHGARAGTMVTAVKSLFSADAGASHPRQFLDDAARAIKRMELGRMAMGLCLARLEGRSLILSSAGMPPFLIHRHASGNVEEVALQGMPLGGLASDYQERILELAPLDTILMLTDGLPELPNPEGDPLGYPRVRSLFESMGDKAPEEIIAGLAAAAESWSGGQPAKDDITLVVIRMRES